MSLQKNLLINQINKNIQFSEKNSVASNTTTEHDFKNFNLEEKIITDKLFKLKQAIPSWTVIMST